MMEVLDRVVGTEWCFWDLSKMKSFFLEQIQGNAKSGIEIVSKKYIREELKWKTEV